MHPCCRSAAPVRSRPRLGLRIGRRRGWRELRWHQRHVVAAERTIDKRLLPVAGGLQHVVADETERLAHIQPRRRQMVRQRQRERAVLRVAVQRGRTGLGGIGDQGVRAGRLDLGEAASDRTRRQGPLHALGKRIVAAGIEDHQPELLGGFDRHQHAVQRKRLVVDVGVAFQLRIHRNQVIGAVDLHAVAGVVDHGDIGVAGGVGKIAQRPPRLQPPADRGGNRPRRSRPP